MTRSIRQILSILVVFPWIVAGCATTPPASPPQPSVETAPAEPTESARELWGTLTSPPPGTAIGPPVFEAWGLTVGGNLYRPGYQEFLDGRNGSPELEREYRRWLNEQLLALRWLEDNPLLDDSNFRGRIRLRMIEAISKEVWLHAIQPRPIDPLEVRRIYEERLEALKSPEMVRVKIILVATVEEARGILQRLRGGESFVEIAAAESRHESRSRGGELDPFPRGTYNAALEDKAFAMKPGETEYVTTPAGTFVLEKVAHQRASAPTFDELRPAIEAELRERNTRQARSAAIEKLRREVQERERERERARTTDDDTPTTPGS